MTIMARDPVCKPSIYEVCIYNMYIFYQLIYKNTFFSYVFITYPNWGPFWAFGVNILGLRVRDHVL